jgi:hypothetical protein
MMETAEHTEIIEKLSGLWPTPKLRPIIDSKQ